MMQKLTYKAQLSQNRLLTGAATCKYVWRLCIKYYC